MTRKFRYEYPPLSAHFLEAPHSDAAVKYLQRTYPHNFDDVLATLVEIPHWPDFWKIVDQNGHALPRKVSGGPRRLDDLDA